MKDQEYYDLQDTEYTHDLEAAGRRAADIVLDCLEKGPLHQYLTTAREKASRAIEELAYTNPTDTTSLAGSLAMIRLYLDAANWAQAVVLDGKSARDVIIEQHGETPDDE